MAAAADIHLRIQTGLESVPMMPNAVAEVMQMTRDDRYSAKGLADVVCKDPVLAARVLQLANSGFYGTRQDVTSIHKAVLLVGFEMVKNLVLSIFVHSVAQCDVSGYAHTSASLWQHCLGVATTASMLASEVAPELADTAYTAGLLHDIGKVVLSGAVGDLVPELLERVRAHRVPFHEAERAVLGVTHCEAGDFVARRWRMAPLLSRVIRCHHNPEAVDPQDRTLALVCLADRICDLFGVGAGLDATNTYELPERALESAGISTDRLEKFLTRVMPRLWDMQAADPLASAQLGR